MAQRGSLLPLVQRFFEHDPKVAARTFETMEESEAIKALESLPSSLAAEAFRYLHISNAVEILKEAPPELLHSLVNNLEPEQGAAILLSLQEEARQELLNQLPDKTRDDIRELLEFPGNSAGSIMTRDFLAFHSTTRVSDAIRKIRRLARRRSIETYVYVLDPDSRLVGVVNMRDLMLANGRSTLDTVMIGDVFSIDPFMGLEEVAQRLSDKKYFAVPVLDAERRLLGVVKADRLISEVQDEATEDIQKMFGAGGNERPFSPVPFSLRKRLPWLHVNLATAFLAAAVVAMFEDVIARITVLAVFLPVVAGQGGNAGAQSLAVVMRGLVMREIPKDKVWSLVMKECWIGALNGLVIGVVTALIAWIWHGNPFLGLVIGLAMIVNLVAAGFAGAAIPITMKALRLDPAQSSSIVLTTITDVVGFFSFLGFAVVFQQYLL